MNLSRCDNGHFYDKEKYATCPHCAGGNGADNSLTSVFTGDVTEPASMPVSPSPGVTEQFAPETPFPVAGIPADQATVSMDYIDNKDTPTVSLQDDMDQTVTASSTFDIPDPGDDHTIGFFDDDLFSSSNSTGKTIPFHQINKVSTPCVGWLVALGGEQIGTDFRLKVGKNFIGRNSDMDVALTGDKSVSRDRHAIVVYEPKSHLYLVQPGESSSLVYRNNEVVLSPVKLGAYDVITVGDVNLLFMPLCGDQFNWSDLLEERKKNQ